MRIEVLSVLRVNFVLRSIKAQPSFSRPAVAPGLGRCEPVTRAPVVITGCCCPPLLCDLWCVRGAVCDHVLPLLSFHVAYCLFILPLLFSSCLLSFHLAACLFIYASCLFIYASCLFILPFVFSSCLLSFRLRPLPFQIASCLFINASSIFIYASCLFILPLVCSSCLLSV